MTKSTTERLIYMANQIAANLATEDDPVSATANHIDLYWDPRMKQMIRDHGDAGLSPIAAAAIVGLARAGV
jgi:formate dehydrogenase subunit delta